MFNWISNSKQAQILAEKKTIKDSVQSLVDESIVSPRFVIFTILAGLMASLGVIMNSTPIIIGAMLIAPLLNPILSLAVGVGAGSFKLIWHSIVSLFAGLFLTILSTMLIPFLIGPRPIAPELLDTLEEPNLYVLVAFIAGVVAVYSWFTPSINKVIGAAAIAAALVPPIAILGSLIVSMETSYLTETLLIVGSNLVGIFLGGLCTFLIIAIASKRPTEKVGKQVDQEVAKKNK